MKSCTKYIIFKTVICNINMQHSQEDQTEILVRYVRDSILFKFEYLYEFEAISETFFKINLTYCRILFFKRQDLKILRKSFGLEATKCDCGRFLQLFQDHEPAAENCCFFDYKAIQI
jgi:hypothetical protein